ncbi:MAG: hypothetical protein UV64_C0017G0019, partial [Parcubacteria group bacterium GW2011_GWC1_43_11b]
AVARTPVEGQVRVQLPIITQSEE